MYKGSGKAPGRWTSFIIGKNVFNDLYPLTDNTGRGNHTVIYLGNYDGGELWEEVKDGEPAGEGGGRGYKMGDDGKVIPGRVIETHDRYHMMNSGRRYGNGNQEWTGQRCTMHYYDARKEGMSLSRHVTNCDPMASTWRKKPAPLLARGGETQEEYQGETVEDGQTAWGTGNLVLQWRPRPSLEIPFHQGGRTCLPDPQVGTGLRDLPHR